MEIGDEIVEVRRGRLLVAFEGEELTEAHGALAQDPAVGALVEVTAQLGGQRLGHQAASQVVVQLLCFFTVHVFHHHK
ncbi:MAG: hypothetical protein FJ395_20235 [Verrucomicrobia bacterium]|nr:hypothetical protein [Verrucomicrobiota bacterium]